MGSSDRRRSQRTAGRKVDEAEAPLLLKIQPITVPLTFTCYDRGTAFRVASVWCSSPFARRDAKLAVVSRIEPRFLF
jgi:hypothetical protein